MTSPVTVQVRGSTPPTTLHARLTVSPVAWSRSAYTTAPGSISLPSTSTQALIAARELLELLPPPTIAVVTLYVQSAASIDRIAETAPTLEVFSAAPTSRSVTGA